ncbi:MAG: protein N-lysine methyltransferase family protein [Gammaproteobacteria bacterium]|nr:protein N-lysine methyltransferase family protein [Gammaproteobacteria bacterium]
MTPLRLRYQTIEFDNTDIHLCTLRDKQQFYDPDGIAKDLGISSSFWPVFGIIWPSSLVLAHFINNYETDDKRILEIGCGMALSSLLLNKQNADITATDHHPEVEKFLIRNTSLNNGKTITFVRADWADKQDSLGKFDLIIGSDLLYEDQHIDLLANFINAHAKPTCEVIITDPARGRKNKLSIRMEEYGYSASHKKPLQTDYLDHNFKGHILTFNR